MQGVTTSSAAQVCEAIRGWAGVGHMTEAPRSPTPASPPRCRNVPDGAGGV